MMSIKIISSFSWVYYVKMIDTCDVPAVPVVNARSLGVRTLIYADNVAEESCIIQTA